MITDKNIGVKIIIYVLQYRRCLLKRNTDFQFYSSFGIVQQNVNSNVNRMCKKLKNQIYLHAVWYLVERHTMQPMK